MYSSATNFQLAVFAGFVHQRFGLPRIEHRIADESAVDKVNAHGALARFVDAVEKLGITGRLCVRHAAEFSGGPAQPWLSR